MAPDERADLRRGKGSRLPLVFVLVSLTFAIALPHLTQRRITRFRNEINGLANPALLNLAGIQRDLALEASQRRAFLLTGDDRMEAHFVESRASRVAEEMHLIEYTKRLDSSNDSAMSRAAARIKELNRGLDSLMEVGTSRPVMAAALEEQRQRFLLIQALTDSLESAVERAADARRTAIANTETFVATSSALLLLFGLGSALLVARLGSKFRTLAVRLDESEGRYMQIADDERSARAVAEQRQRDLERVTESRNALLRGFTHDVKNPLGAADGYLSLLHEGVLGEIADKPRGVIAKIRRSVGQALELIRQLLEIARAEAGELEIRPRSTDVIELVRDLTDSFQAQATAKHHALSAELPDGLPCVQTDPGRVRQIVSNLVSNALKYTPEGGQILVRVETNPVSQAADKWELVIAVSDNGAGIPGDKLPLLFAEFTRLDPAAAEGAGIGLAISRKIAQALGGDIAVESVVGVGSTFSLHLPGAPVD
jgi:signal transduction histidine kinase